MLTSTFSQSNQSNWNSYAQQQKPLWNAVALLYTIGGYYGGVCLLCAEALSLNALGIFLVTHALVLSAYWVFRILYDNVTYYTFLEYAAIINTNTKLRWSCS